MELFNTNKVEFILNFRVTELLYYTEEHFINFTKVKSSCYTNYNNLNSLYMYSNKYMH